MSDIIIFILLLIVIIIFIRCCLKQFYKSNDMVNRLFFCIYPIVTIIFFCVFYLDKLNIPTRYGLLDNLSSERWFSYVSELTSSMIGAIIGGVFVVYITKEQIEKQNKNYLNDKRIQNAPLFKYLISNEKIDYSNDCCIYNGDGKSYNYNLYLQIENIGLNHARDVYINFCGNDFPTEFEYKVDEFQSILKKDTSICFRLNLNYIYKNDNKTKNIKIIVKYKDMLENNYFQEIEIEGIPTNVIGSKHEGYRFNILKCKINKEKFIIDADGDKIC